MKQTTKAKKNDIVWHNGQEWKVIGRSYYGDIGQSYYELKRGYGRGKPADYKMVRSDRFVVV